jgi:hypothetical protein
MKDALIVLFAFSFPLVNLAFLGWNIAIYYQQQHSYKRIIEAWRKQDKTVLEKAQLYDREHPNNSTLENVKHPYCSFYYQPIADSSALAIQSE